MKDLTTFINDSSDILSFIGDLEEYEYKANNEKKATQALELLFNSGEQYELASNLHAYINLLKIRLNCYQELIGVAA